MNVTATLKGNRAGTVETSPLALFIIRLVAVFLLFCILMIISAFYEFSSVELKHHHYERKREFTGEEETVE